MYKILILRANIKNTEYIHNHRILQKIQFLQHGNKYTIRKLQKAKLDICNFQFSFNNYSR